MRRSLACAFLVIASAQAQFKSTVPLILAPATVTGSKGHYIDGFTASDLILYDDNVPRTIQMDWTTYPIDQDFTGDPDPVIHALRMLRKEGSSAQMLDALQQALAMLEKRAPNRRRIILMVAEKRDRASSAKLDEVMARVQRLNATVYWLTYSATVHRETKTMEGLKPEAERIKVPKCALCPAPDDRGVPLDVGPGGLLYSLTINFLKKDALEEAIQLIGEGVHRQYILSFQSVSGPGNFHALKVVVKDQPELRAKTRDGYWPVN